MNLFNPFSGAFGLDISDHALKVVQLARRRYNFKKQRYQIKFLAAWALPPELIVNGELKKPELVIKALKNTVFRQGRPHLKTHWVVASLPETKSFLKVITLKIPTDKLTTEAVEEAAAAYLPFSLNEVYLDWQLLTTAKKTAAAEVMIGAVQKTIADSYTYLLNIAGLTPLALEIEALALARALISQTNPPQNEAVAILDLGATRSGFVLYDKGAVQFSLSLPFSGIKIDAKIAELLQITAPEAELLKKNLAKAAPAQQKEIKKLLESEFEELAQKIAETIQFYKTHFPLGSRLKNILLCGGSAKLPELTKRLSLKLKIKTRLADPTVNLGGPPLPRQVDLTMATALGLAIRALENQVI